MKKFLLVAVALLCLSGCQANTATEVPIDMPTNALTVTTAPTATPKLTATPEPMATLEPTATPKLTATPTPTPKTSATVLCTEKNAELHANLQKRIDEILNTKTEIVHSDTYILGETYTGTAYYVSNNGDDNNDGLTPETAWQSFSKVAYELSQPEENRIIQPGDAVFFRRGDVFRAIGSGLHISIEGITISAYGEGDKPIITGSSENGSGVEKWELIYEDATGKKIWQYYRDMHDIARIVMNDGEIITTRIYEYYDENGYISCEDTYWWMHSDMGLTLLDTLLPLEEVMTENYTIISRPVRIKETPDYQNYSAPTFGPLYLRCDEGNPGELFESIEFTEYTAFELVYFAADDIVFDNISFRCAGHFYMSGHRPWYTYENRVIQNCEFAYGGATVNQYINNGNGSYYTVAIGDGIYTVVKNTTIRNNYFHDAISTAVTYESGGESEISGGYFNILDNVMVNTMGIRLDGTEETLKHLDSVIIRGNHIWNNGHLDNGRFAYSEGAIFLSPNRYGECIIEDNLLYCTVNGYESNALLNIWYYTEDGDTVPQIRNNTYVQYGDRCFGYFSMFEERSIYMSDPELLTKVAEIIGDTTSEFYMIE